MINIRPLRPTDTLDNLIALSRTFFTEYESHHPAFFQIDALPDSDIIACITCREGSANNSAIHQ